MNVFAANISFDIFLKSIFPRDARNPVIVAHLRAALFAKPASDKDAQASLLKTAENTAAFLRSDRIYKELLERYSPLHDLTEEERIKATANRVGLNTPKEYKPS